MKQYTENDVSIVILNYLNYTDTINCVSSIIEHESLLRGVVIVDNGSYNESYEKLRANYQDDSRIKIISLKNNLGFAKGNNYGIQYARKCFKTDFVLVLNNDTLFIEDNYISLLLKHYKRGIGLIGSRIVNCEYKIQGQSIFYLNLKSLAHKYLNDYAKLNDTSYELDERLGENTVVLHGCAILFTPDFFSHYKGFYKRTFLYYEEPILYFMCKSKGLKQIHIKNATIMHLEDKSSEISFGNDNYVKLKYVHKSEKWVIYWNIRAKIESIFRKNNSNIYSEIEV